MRVGGLWKPLQSTQERQSARERRTILSTCSSPQSEMKCDRQKFFMYSYCSNGVLVRAWKALNEDENFTWPNYCILCHVHRCSHNSLVNFSANYFLIILKFYWKSVKSQRNEFNHSFLIFQFPKSFSWIFLWRGFQLGSNVFPQLRRE